MGDSSLIELNIGLVSKFGIDYMHCVLLGVMKKLLNFWLHGSNFNVKLPSIIIQQMSDQFVSLRPFIQIEINRKPRPFADLPRFKATEYRTFLLYLGPLVLHNTVDIAVYEHFLLLHCAITILCCKVHISKFSTKFTSYLLELFIIHGEKIYGNDFCVYNVHLLSHLSEDVDIFGSLDNFSAFPFENLLGQIKHLLKSPTNPLAQICRRITENKMLITSKSIKEDFKLLYVHNSGPLLGFHTDVTQYKKLQLNGFSLTISSHSFADCHVLLNFKLFQIDNIVQYNKLGGIFIIGKSYLSQESFYTYPIKSDLLGLFKVKKVLCKTYECHKVHLIQNKCIVLNYGENHLISYPLLHTIDCLSKY